MKQSGSKSVSRRERHALQSPCDQCQVLREYKKDWTFSRCQDCKSWGHQPVFYVIGRMLERIHDLEKLTEMINLKLNSGLIRSLKDTVEREALSAIPANPPIQSLSPVHSLSAFDYLLWRLPQVEA